MDWSVYLAGIMLGLSIAMFATLGSDRWGIIAALWAVSFVTWLIVFIVSTQ